MMELSTLITILLKINIEILFVQFETINSFIYTSNNYFTLWERWKINDKNWSYGCCYYS